MFIVNLFGAECVVQAANDFCRFDVRFRLLGADLAFQPQHKLKHAAFNALQQLGNRKSPFVHFAVNGQAAEQVKLREIRRRVKFGQFFSGSVRAISAM